jgi:DNA-binding IclR family transcriptional regulator
MEQRLAELLRYLAANDGASAARVCKQLGLARSELQRLLAVLEDDAATGGLGLVRRIEDRGRDRLALTPRGRQWLERRA